MKFYLNKNDDSRNSLWLVLHNRVTSTCNVDEVLLKWLYFALHIRWSLNRYLSIITFFATHYEVFELS
jgi:hypothetical protein